MGAANRHDPARGLLQPPTKLRVISRLEPEHAGNQLQAVLHPMIDLFQKHLLMLQRRLESPFLALPFNRHSQNVCGALHESDVAFVELPRRSAVYFEHAVGRALALQDDVYGSPDLMRASRSGVRNRSSLSRWFEITGLPVCSA